MSIIEKARDEVLALNDKVDAKVDGAIDAAAEAVKAKTGRFTWAAIAGVALAIVVVFGIAIAFL